MNGRGSRRSIALTLVALATVVSANSVSLGQESEGNSDANAELVEMVVMFLEDGDPDVRALAHEQVRADAPGEAATRAFAAKLADLPPDARVGLMRALAARGDRAARSDVLKQLDSEDAAVRSAAISALRAIGTAGDVPRLVAILKSGSDEARTAARNSLERLIGDDVSEAITEQMNQATGAERVALIEVLARQRTDLAVPELLKAALVADEQVRRAAMTALGQLADAEHVPGMVVGILHTESGSERAAAEKAVMFVCQRIEPADERARPLIKAMDQQSRDDQLRLMSTLGRVGGQAALERVEAAIASRDGSRHSSGIRAIANWPDASIAPRLIELIKSDPHPGHDTTLLRALIRVAPLPDERSDAERLELLQQAMTMARRDAERTLALDRARAIRIPETLRFIRPFVQQPKFAEQACLTIVELAHHRELRESAQDEFHAALDLVIATSKDDVVRDRARRYKNNQTWVRR